MRINRYGYYIYPVLIAFCLAWAVTGWLTMRASGGFVPGSSVHPGKKNMREKLPDTAFIIKKNIFDADLSAAPAVAGKSAGSGTAVSQDSGFDGRLIGVLSGDGTEMAVIMYKDKMYMLRLDETKDGLTLDDVDYYYAIVSKGGERYRLLLKAEKGSSAPGAPVRVTDSGTTEKVTLTRKEVVDKLSDVNTVIKSVLIVPYERSGKFMGYRVRRMTNTSVLRKIGIQPNDIIIRLNGKSLETPSVFFEALKNAENLTAVTLDILRKGVKKTIYVEING